MALSQEDLRRQRERMESDQFILGLLGANLVIAEQGFARVELDADARHLNGLGLVQGGVLYSLGDYATAVAANYATEPMVSLDSSISYLKSGKPGKIIAEAREISRSRQFTSLEARITDEKGTLLAILHSRGFILKQ
ncbi:MAG: PaaI family thioesterase [Planctomycetia bacterium]|nr:PaaI family thioesterase [Planctomycetia bacterium]